MFSKQLNGKSQFNIRFSITLIPIMMFAVIHAAATSESLTDVSPQNEIIRVTDLRCEYLANPMGIDVAQPRLSWRIESGIQGQKQTAYRVLVASSRKKLADDIGDRWDSGKVSLGRSVNIAYGGNPLESRMECFWKVRIWDKSGNPCGWSEPARWSMGLLRPEDWTASWIRTPRKIQEAPALTADSITKATYRTLDGDVAVDVTEVVKKEIDKIKPFIVDYKVLGGDPAPGVVKELVVDYVKNGESVTVRANDFEPLFSTDLTSVQTCPWLRKTVELKAAPDRALVQVASRGYHELWVNGRKVDDYVLDPAVSVLKKRTLYITYDIAALLRKGPNVIGLWLGRGWNAQGIPGVTDERPLVCLQGDIWVGDTQMRIGTDKTWSCAPSSYSIHGPWAWGNYGGEILDARFARPTWCSTDDSLQWTPVEEAPAPTAVMDSQLTPRNRIGKRIQAVSCTADGDDKYVLDFGTDLTGWLRLRMPAMSAGNRVTIQYAGSGKRKFHQRDQFISAGGQGEVFQSKFNYRGFRTVIVTGLPTKPKLNDAIALLIESDLEPAGSFSCSNDLINRIYHLNMWTIRCLNMGGYYVDCPHRERLGYGDGQVAVEGCIMNFWMPNFYRKWLRDWADTQGPTGEIPFSTPYHMPATGDTFGREGPPGWGGAFPAIAWRTYLYYGDRRILEELYEPMRRFMTRLESHTKDDLLDVYGDEWQRLGDWVPPRRGMDTHKWPSDRANRLFNNCYRIYLWGLMEKIDLALGREADAKQCRTRIETIRPLIHAEFYDPANGIYVIDEQAYQIMPLMTGIVPESLRSKIMQKLEDGILVKNKGHLDTGMLGTYFLLQYLSDIGRDDLLFTIVNKKTYPGWGYMLEEGATTMWEQWNGYYSRIHSCFTSPANWFHNGLAGIRPDWTAPGFKNIIIEPAMVGDLQWVKSHHDSPYGRIVSNWEREGDRVSMEVTIPVNSTATVHVPSRVAADVTVNGNSLGNTDHVSILRVEKEKVVLKIDSGSYVFVSKNNKAN